MIVDEGRYRVFSSRAEGERPGATPVLLIHGVGMSHRYYAPLRKALARTRDVHALDLPGFGSFGRPRTDFAPERMARGLAAVQERLGLPRVVLIGHSMGAQWVVEVARQRPDLVEAIVLIGPVVDARHRTLRSQVVALASDALREPPLANAILLADYIRCGIPWYSAQVRHMMGYPIEQRMSEVGVPALIIRGGDDPIAGLKWCRALRDRGSDADLVLVPGRAHVVQYTAPRATASAIEAFLADRRRARDAT